MIVTTRHVRPPSADSWPVSLTSPAAGAQLRRLCKESLAAPWR